MTDDRSADLRSQSAEKRARKTSTKMARLTGGGTSARSVEMLKTVTKYGPAGLPEKIQAGEISLNAAYQETRRFIIEARRAGAEIPPECRIGGRIEPVNTDPCPHCNGTGRKTKET
jgi:hypothetical protein